MKRGKIVLGALTMALLCGCNNEIPAMSSQMTEVIIENPSVMASKEGNNVANEITDEREQLIRNFVSAVNSKDLDKYIELFSSEIRQEMRDYISQNGSEDFFTEPTREIIKIEKKDRPVPEKEEGLFEDAVIYAVTENVIFPEDTKRDTYELNSGTVVHDYVIVKEKGEWKLYRISVAPKN